VAEDGRSGSPQKEGPARGVGGPSSSSSFKLTLGTPGGVDLEPSKDGEERLDPASLKLCVFAQRPLPSRRVGDGAASGSRAEGVRDDGDGEGEELRDDGSSKVDR
jgi:hypothetical protein